MLLVREVYSDWHRTPRRDQHPPGRPGRCGAADGGHHGAGQALRRGRRVLLSRLRTFLAFPEWVYLAEPVNTMTPPRPTPGGLATQFSSAVTSTWPVTRR